jgi:hypothetical protein
MKQQWLTLSEMTDLTGRSRAAIYKAVEEGRLYRDPDTRKFDPAHSTNAAYIERSRAETGQDDAPPPSDAPEDLQELYREKIRADIDRIREMTRKYQLENAKTKGGLVDVESLRHGWGVWKFAVEQNLLTLGERIGRGDVDLRDRVEKEVKRSLEAAKEYAEREILVYGGVPDDQIDEFFAEVPDDDDD